VTGKGFPINKKIFGTKRLRKIAEHVKHDFRPAKVCHDFLAVGCCLATLPGVGGLRILHPLYPESGFTTPHSPSQNS